MNKFEIRMINYIMPHMVLRVSCDLPNEDTAERQFCMGFSCLHTSCKLSY